MSLITAILRFWWRVIDARQANFKIFCFAATIRVMKFLILRPTPGITDRMPNRGRARSDQANSTDNLETSYKDTVFLRVPVYMSIFVLWLKSGVWHFFVQEYFCYRLFLYIFLRYKELNSGLFTVLHDKLDIEKEKLTWK